MESRTFGVRPAPVVRLSRCRVGRHHLYLPSSGRRGVGRTLRGTPDGALRVRGKGWASCYRQVGPSGTVVSSAPSGVGGRETCRWDAPGIASTERTRRARFVRREYPR